MNKRTIFIQVFFISFILSSPIFAQNQIEYGSNNGEYITIQETQIYYEEYGEGTPLFLLHGGLGSIQVFKDVIPELSKHFKVIAVDSPGHGRSEQADTLSYQLITDYISEMIDRMELDSVYTMGCSDGAIVSLILAHDRPDKVMKAISDGGIVNKMGYKPDIIESIESMSPETTGKDWIDNYKKVNPQPDKWEKFVLNTRSMWLDFPYVDDTILNNINVPTLIMLGEHDIAITIEHALEMHRTIEGSNLGIIPNAGHCVSNTKPDLLSDITIDFLTSD